MGQLLLRCFCIFGLLSGLLSGRAGAQAPPPATAGPIVPANANNANSTNASVFIVAHQDDWQLFMGSRAYDNVQRHRRAVFIVVTAGQGDQATEAWWRTRELACVNSVRTAADPLTVKQPEPTFFKTSIRGHQIITTCYRNTVVYFLRLPDGGGRAQGFSSCNFQTLNKLKAGQSGGIRTIDGSNQYESWSDLTNTVRAIIQREVRPNWTLWVHSPNPDDKVNRNDHPDHLNAGFIAEQATRNMECRRSLFNGYGNAQRPVNLNGVQQTNQTAMFAAYCRTMAERGQPSGWQPDHLCWLGRQYSVLHHGAASSTTAANAARTRNDTLLSAPTKARLAIPTPNPCVASSVLAYDLPDAADVNLSLFDIQGRLIRTLVDARQNAGHYEVWLDVTQFPANGVYLCRLQAGSALSTQRVQIQH